MSTKEFAEKLREQARKLREEAGRIRRTMKVATGAEERCNVRADVWDQCADALDALIDPDASLEMIESPARCTACGLLYRADTTGVLLNKCICGKVGTLEHTPNITGGTG